MEGKERIRSLLRRRAVRLAITMVLVSVLLLLLLGRMRPDQMPSTLTEPDSHLPTQSSADDSLATSSTTVSSGLGAISPAPTAIPTPVDGLVVNPLFREASAVFYHEHYVVSQTVEIGWTGNHEACSEGNTSQAFRDAVLQRINYFRAMAGVPANVKFSDELNQKAQKAALMISVNGRLSHVPDSSWQCYSLDGAIATRSSNLFLGVYSWQAIDGYIQDAGSSNYFVPHRRWLLCPRTTPMGTGDTPPVSGYAAANALWVLGSMSEERPKTRDDFVAWPPPGYVPYQVVFPRWSFAYDGADFARASVSMTFHDNNVPVTLLQVVNGYGENTLVWEPHIRLGERPDTDRWYTVRVSNVIIKGFVWHFTYVVAIFDPES